MKPQTSGSLFNKTVLTLAVLASTLVCYGQHQITRRDVYGWDFEPNVREYVHSGDYTEQVLVLSDRVALIKSLVGTNKLSFMLAQVEWGGEPEFESLSGYAALNTKLRTEGIQEISMVSSNTLLLDSGPSREPRYTLADLDKKTAVKKNNLEDFHLEKSVNEPIWIPASVYFDRQLVTFLKTSGKGQRQRE